MSITRASLLVGIFLVGLGLGCGTAKDRQEADGTRVLGEQTWKDGTVTTKNIFYPDGRKLFNSTKTPGGVQKIEHIEYPDGHKEFGITRLPNGTVRVERIERTDETKVFDATFFPDHSYNVGRVTGADGKEIHMFGSVQNDQEGYAGIKWGTNITVVTPHPPDNSKSSFVLDQQENEVVAAALGIPTRDTIIAGTVLSTSIDLSLVPAEFNTVLRDDVDLIFYGDEFALAFSKLNAHNYETIASDVASKFTKMDTRYVKWGGGAMSDRDSTSLDVQLFKRGDTNTRVFLLKKTDHEGIGMDISSVYLLYVPDFYFEKIHDDISAVEEAKESAQTGKQHESERADTQKIQ